MLFTERALALPCGAMLSSREGYRAALVTPIGAGANRIDTIGVAALERAQLDPGSPARCVAYKLGFRLLAMMDSSVDAEVSGRRIAYLWDPDPQQTEQNIFLGLAIALAPRHATAAELCRLAAILAGDGRPGLRLCRPVA